MNKQQNEIKRWTAKHKTQIVLNILKGKTTVAEIARQYDLTPGEVECWVEEGIAGMENNFSARPRDIREQYERKLAETHAALGEKALELKAIKKWQRLLDEQNHL